MKYKRGDKLYFIEYFMEEYKVREMKVNGIKIEKTASSETVRYFEHHSAHSMFEHQLTDDREKLEEEIKTSKIKDKKGLEEGGIPIGSILVQKDWKKEEKLFKS